MKIPDQIFIRVSARRDQKYRLAHPKYQKRFAAHVRVEEPRCVEDDNETGRSMHSQPQRDADFEDFRVPAESISVWE